MNRVSRVLLGLSALLIAFVAAPALAKKGGGAVRTVKTPAFTVSVPHHWKVQALRVEKGNKLGKWVIRGNQTKLYVRVGNMRKEAIDKLFNRYVTESLRKHVRHLEMESFEAKDFKQGEAGIGFLYGVSKRKTKSHGHKFGVMVIKANDRKRIVYASMGGTEAGWKKNASIFNAIVSSIELK